MRTDGEPSARRRPSSVGTWNPYIREARPPTLAIEPPLPSSVAVARMSPSKRRWSWPVALNTTATSGVLRGGKLSLKA
jgi:hypothetical protein